MKKFLFPLLVVLLWVAACENTALEGTGLDDSLDYEQHVKELKKIIPEGFTIVIQEPFVVIGDEPRAKVRSRAENTVKWTVDRLKAMYFDKDPAHIIDIWLFKNNHSYEKYSMEIFNIKPDTPFGFSSPQDHALIINIATGDGTLVHEIVHPYIAANFPGCPVWFNEGLGSLYEGCSGKGNEITGLINWRLRSLQEAIKRGRVMTFKELTGASPYRFYRENPGTNYAQARYLCYYLQQKGLLKTFYHRFRANFAKDPTGFETLKEVLGEPDMDGFKKKWEIFVLQLFLPRR